MKVRLLFSCRHPPNETFEFLVLDWITLYWFSRAGPAASIRLYYEIVQAGQIKSDTAAYNPTPLGVSYFPNEIYPVPKSYAPS